MNYLFNNLYTNMSKSLWIDGIIHFARKHNYRLFGQASSRKSLAVLHFLDRIHAHATGTSSNTLLYL